VLNLFSMGTMPKGLRPIIHAEAEHAPRDIVALKDTLDAWVVSVLEPLRGTLDFETTSDILRDYVINTLIFAAQSSIPHAVNYHRAAMRAACQRPPTYILKRDGPVCEMQHLIHIRPFMRQTSSGNTRFPGKRPRQAAAATNPPPAAQTPDAPPRTPKRQRGTSQAGGADHCTIHPQGTHTNARCWDQGAPRTGTRQPGTAARTTAPAAGADD
jgi:hypothetical protein